MNVLRCVYSPKQSPAPSPQTDTHTHCAERLKALDYGILSAFWGVRQVHCVTLERMTSPQSLQPDASYPATPHTRSSSGGAPIPRWLICAPVWRKKQSLEFISYTKSPYTTHRRPRCIRTRTSLSWMLKPGWLRAFHIPPGLYISSDLLFPCSWWSLSCHFSLFPLLSVCTLSYWVSCKQAVSSANLWAPTSAQPCPFTVPLFSFGCLFVSFSPSPTFLSIPLSSCSLSFHLFVTLSLPSHTHRPSPSHCSSILNRTSLITCLPLAFARCHDYSLSV